MNAPVVNPHARSPYQRRGKQPWKYSGQLLAISEARRDGHHFEADRLARAHSEAHGLRAHGFPAPGPVDW